MFRVGQKVVCVDASFHRKYMPRGYYFLGDENMDGLKKNAVYTIRSLGFVGGIPTCRLAEIVRDYEPALDGEAGFARGRFRPLVERKTDISIFQSFLVPSRETESME